MNICPQCKTPLYPGYNNGVHGMSCLQQSCGYFVPDGAEPVKAAKTSQKRPQRESGVSETYADEAELVQAIVCELTARGFGVYRIGQHRADKAGTDEGVSDLMISELGWCKPMEVKIGDGRPTNAQVRFCQEGGGAVVWTVADAVRWAEDWRGRR